ncbi:DUF6950 family protein [Shewanella algae]|uniref:DUF6950 family protein n=1 Tax=Shewanella algae TaxID=38313 RepID=UPI0030048786
MNEKESVHLFEVLERYNNQPLIYGKRDCHLLFLTVYKYDDILSKLENRYTTISGGLRVATRLFNNDQIAWKNMDQMLAEEFSEVDISGYLQLGDCVYDRKSRVVGIVTYDGIFWATRVVNNKYTLWDDCCFTLTSWGNINEKALNGFRAYRKNTEV